MIKLSFTLVILTFTLLNIPFSGINNSQISRVSKDAKDHDRHTGGSKSFYKSSYWEFDGNLISYVARRN